MQEQRSFNNEVPDIVSANEPHMALLLLLDTSGSMAGVPINELNNGVNRFKLEVCEDNTTRETLDVAIVEFNSNIRVVQEFVPIEHMRPVNLEAMGGTNMAPAIELAIDMVDEQARKYRRSGTEPYKPWILMISDGFADNIDEVAERIHRLESEQKLNFLSVGVEGYDSQTLHKLSRQKVMKLRGYDFTTLFDWVNKSMRSISASSPGERPRGVPLPENIDKDTDEWM